MTDVRAEFDVVVVGAGPAGIAAACSAAAGGRRVALVDDSPGVGGQIWRGEQPGRKSALAQRWCARLRDSGATVMNHTRVVAAPGERRLLAEQPDRALEIRWNRLVLATGARELFLPFPGWTLPGVMGPGGLQALVKGGWPVAGRRVAVCGTGPLLLATAEGLRRHGARVVSITEQAPLGRLIRFGLGLARHPGKLAQGLGLATRLRGVRLRSGGWPVKAEGESEVRQVTLTDGAATWTEDCDLLACGFHLVPNVELPLALGCELDGGFVRVDRWQQTSVPDVYCAGEPTGIGGADCALIEGQIAGLAATGRGSDAEPWLGQREGWHAFRAALARAFALRDELKTLATDATLLCRCEDVALGRVRPFSGWREAKLQSRCGMGACQGRVCGAAARVVLGWGMESVRPPVLPVRVESLITGNLSE